MNSILDEARILYNYVADKPIHELCSVSVNYRRRVYKQKSELQWLSLRSGSTMSMLRAAFVLFLMVGIWSGFSGVSGDDGTAKCGGFRSNMTLLFFLHKNNAIDNIFASLLT